ncbi:MAG: AAA family ATPase [Nitriliruptoraceae bacterium]
MRIRRVRLEHVRAIETCELDFTGDVTVVHAPNERGKSTVIDAIRLALTTKATSKSAVVRGLTPAGADVGSLVELELETAAVHLTVRKRYNRDVETVLTVHAPQAATVTGDEAHDRLRELLDGDVDWTLFDALWLPQGRALDAVGLASDTLARQLGDGGAVDDAAHGDDVLARVEVAYLTLFTPTGRRRKDPLGDLDAHVATLRERRDELDAQLAELDEDIATLAELERSLPALQAEFDGPLREALEVATAAADTLGQLDERRRACVAELEAADERCKAGTEAVEARRAAIDELARLRTRIEERDADLVPAQERLDELEGALTKADDELRSLGDELEARREAQRRAEDALAWYDALQRHAQLDHRQRQVTRIVEDARQAAAALDAIVADEDMIAAIRAAARDLDRAELQRDAAAPTLDVRARRAVDLGVEDETVALEPDGAFTRHVSEPLTVRIGDVADITVRPAAGDRDAQRRVEDARRALAEACAQAGVADVDEADRVDAERRQHLAVLRARDDALASLLDGATPAELAAASDEAAAEAARAAARVDGDELADRDRSMLVDDVERARAATEAAAEAHERAQQQRDEHAAAVAAWQEQHANAQAEQDRDRDEEARRRRALDDAREAVSDATLDERRAAAREAADRAQAALDAVDAERAELDAERVQLEVTTARNAHETARRQLADARERRARLDAKLDALGSQGLGEQRGHVRAELERAEIDLRRLTQRADALELLRGALLAAREEATRTYLAPLRDAIVQLARLLFDTDDVDVELDEDLRIVRRTIGTARLEWDQLSAGAREQLAILSGLAAARLAGADGVPFILDDALGYTDPARMERISALIGQSTGVQVIVLTCVPERFRATGVVPTPLDAA